MTQQVRSHIRRHRSLAGRLQGILEDGVDDLPILERAMRRAMGDEHRAAGRRSSFRTKIAAQRFADLNGLFAASTADLTTVEGVTADIARQVRDGLTHIAEKALAG